MGDVKKTQTASSGKKAAESQVDLFELAERAKKAFGQSNDKKPKSKKKESSKTIPIDKYMPPVDRSGASKAVKWLDKKLPANGPADLGSCAAEICRKFKALCPIDCLAVARRFRDSLSDKKFDERCRNLPDSLPFEMGVTDKSYKCEEAGGVVVPVVYK